MNLKATSPLAEWLSYLENSHFKAIDLGLDRIKSVAEELDLLNPAPYVITVGGTNGKGTTCRLLETILLNQGLRVGVYSSPHLLRYNERVRIQNQDLPDEMHTASFDFIEKHKDEDYFLVMSLDEPHGPHICPKKYVDLYKDYEIPIKENMKDTLEDKPEHHRIWAGDEYLKACREDFKLSPKEFLGCNTFADYEIGRVLDAAAQYEEEPIIIYTSDHGDMMYGHSLTGKGPALYEEITHIPLMIKGFGKGVDKNPVSHINLAPTIFDMFGVPIPKMFEGRSIFEEVKNPEVRCNDYVFMEFGRYEVDHDGFGGYQPLRGAFDGRYKMVINLMTSDELYDLQEDPQEMKNLINEPGYDEIRKRLHEAILDNMYETRDPFRGYYWEDRPWNRITEYKTWDSRLMTRQRENEEYEPRQLDYGTGLPMTSAVRKKGQSDAKFAGKKE